MSPPIRDGSGNDIGAIRLGDGSEISEVRTGAGDVLFSAIPDTVVSRPADNNSGGGQSKAFGIRIQTSQEWPEIDVKISSNSVNLTKAELYRVSDGFLKDDVSLSALSPGEVATFDNAGLSANTKYNIVADAQGSSFTFGFTRPSFPFTSADGNLSIIAGAAGPQGTTGGGEAACFVTVGNI